MKEKFLKVKNYVIKYERIFGSIAFVFGFVVDNFTLTRIDLLLDNLILFSYLLIATASILFLVWLEKKPRGVFLNETVLPLVPLSMQFAFGGLFSGYFVFYSRSGSLWESWFFIALIIAFLLANEALRKKYSRFHFQVSMLFIALFSFSIFFVPILTKSIGAVMFLVSGLISLFLVWLLLLALSFVNPPLVHKSRNTLSIIILSIYVVINGLYFTNLIPPVPLSYKEGGVYNLVERIPNGYRIFDEDRKWYETFIKTKKIHHVPGEPIFVYSAIFAPTDLTTTILHEWYAYNEKSKKWQLTDAIPFSILGGRDGGYRGYSKKQNLNEGKYRVDVVTKRGQLLGRASFVVVETFEPPDLRAFER